MSINIESYKLAPDLAISRILTGLWQIADMERDEKSVNLNTAATAMKKYVEAGFMTFDMADHYGSAEDIAGVFRSKYSGGKDLQLFTKWVPKPGPVTRDDVRTAVERSLLRLKTERIDLLQFHAWNYADPAWLDCLFWLQELEKPGLIGHLGLTNFDTAHLRIVVQSGIKVISNQVCFSLIDGRPKKGMTELCRQSGIGLLAYGTVAGGFLSERWLGKPEPPADDLKTWSAMKYKRFIDAAGGWTGFQNVLQAADRIARKHRVSIANVACRYVLEQTAVAGIIIGARLGQSEHVEDNQKIFQFKLDESDKSELAGAASQLLTLPGDCGDEYRKPPFLTASGDLSHHVETFPSPFPTKPGEDGRTWALSGTEWETIGGFSRAIRRGNTIWVSGTTATHGDRAIGGKDPAAQMHFVIDKIEGALQSLGGKLKDVVRTRVFVRNLSDWEIVARVHGERFAGILPANTLVQAMLVGDEYLVEMEAEAVVL